MKSSDCRLCRYSDSGTCCFIVYYRRNAEIRATFKYYPVPWAALTYDTTLGGYRTNITEDKLRGAPRYTGDDWDWDDRERGRKVYDYYGTPWTVL